MNINWANIFDLASLKLAGADTSRRTSSEKAREMLPRLYIFSILPRFGTRVWSLFLQHLGPYVRTETGWAVFFFEARALLISPSWLTDRGIRYLQPYRRKNEDKLFMQYDQYCVSKYVHV